MALLINYAQANRPCGPRNVDHGENCLRLVSDLDLSLIQYVQPAIGSDPKIP